MGKRGAWYWGKDKMKEPKMPFGSRIETEKVPYGRAKGVRIKYKEHPSGFGIGGNALGEWKLATDLDEIKYSGDPDLSYEEQSTNPSVWHMRPDWMSARFDTDEDAEEAAWEAYSADKDWQNHVPPEVKSEDPRYNVEYIEETGEE